MSKTLRKYYVKLADYTDFLWHELDGATSLKQAKQFADQNNNLSEIGMLHLPYEIRVISRKNAGGEWEDV